MKYLSLILLLVSFSLAAQSELQNGFEHPMEVSDISSDITLTGTVQGTVQISLLTSTGREVHRTRKVVRPGSNSVSIPASVNRNQLLILHVTDGRWNYSKQIVLR